MSLMGKLFGGKGDDKKKTSKRSSVRRSPSSKSRGAMPRNESSRAPTTSKRSSVRKMPSVAKVPSKKAAAASATGSATTPGGRITKPAADTTRRKRTSMKGKQIGALLIKKDVVTEEQVNKALTIQEKKGGLLGQILVAMEVCKKADIGAVLKKQRTITTVFLDGVQFEPEALEQLPREFCEKHRLIAFEKIGNHLCVAMANVLDAQAKNEIKERVQLQIKTFDAGWKEIQEAIQTHMGQEGASAEVAVSETPLDVPDEKEIIEIELPEEELIQSMPELPSMASSSAEVAEEPAPMEAKTPDVALPMAKAEAEAPEPVAESESLPLDSMEVIQAADTVDTSLAAALTEDESVMEALPVIEDVSEEIGAIEEVSELEPVVDVDEEPISLEEPLEVEEIGLALDEPVAAIEEPISIEEVEEPATAEEIEKPVFVEEEVPLASVIEILDEADVIEEAEALEPIIEISEAPASESEEEAISLEELVVAPIEIAVSAPVAATPVALPNAVLNAIPISQGYFAEVVQWGAADAERRWLAEHLADNVLPAGPAPELTSMVS